MKRVTGWTVAALLLAMIVVLPTTVTSGLNYCDSMGCSIQFWGAHEHDGIWHMAVSRMLADGHGQIMPTLAGVKLTGYNIMLDWVLALLSNISGVSLGNWYFRIIPLVWFGTFVLMLHKIQIAYKLNKYFTPIAIIFGFLGTSFSYLITLARSGTLFGSSSLLSMQSALTLFNPQLGLSLLCVIGYWLVIAKKKLGIYEYAQIGVLLAIALGLKFYTGIIMGMMILAWVGSQARFELADKPRYLVKLALLAIPSFIVLILFYSPGTGNFPLIWRPFAPVNPLIEDKSLLYIPQLANRLYSENGLILFIVELVITILFITMNFGSRLFGVVALFWSKKRLTQLEYQLIVGTLAALACSVLLVQRGVWWNTVQFLHFALFMSGILATLGLVQSLQNKSRWTYWIVGTVLLVTIAPNIDVTRTYLTYPGTSQISSAELEALEFLNKLPDGVVYTPVFTRNEMSNSNPPLLSETHDTAYIPAYSGKQTYLSDQIQLELLSLQYRERLEKMMKYDCEILNNVKYLYEQKTVPYSNNFESCSNTSLKRVFENETATIYIVER